MDLAAIHQKSSPVMRSDTRRGGIGKGEEDKDIGNPHLLQKIGASVVAITPPRKSRDNRPSRHITDHFGDEKSK